MNYMKEVAEMLGVELGEEFRIKEIEDTYYKLTNEGLLGRSLIYYSMWLSKDKEFIKLLLGEYTIAWKPKDEEEYYYPSFESENGVDWHFWYGDNHDKKIRNIVGIYKTPEQAQEKAKELGWLE